MIEHSTDNRVIAAMLALFNLRRALDEAERGNEPLVVVAIDDLRALLGEVINAAASERPAAQPDS